MDYITKKDICLFIFCLVLVAVLGYCIRFTQYAVDLNKTDKHFFKTVYCTHCHKEMTFVIRENDLK